jgi:hypothetical protein
MRIIEYEPYKKINDDQLRLVIYYYLSICPRADKFCAVEHGNKYLTQLFLIDIRGQVVIIYR